MVGHCEKIKRNITVHLVPLAGIGEWLAGQGRAGIWVEPRVYAGLWFVLNETVDR